MNNKTGFKDKTGKEIYEGDIVNVRFNFGYGMVDCPCEVIYVGGAFYFFNEEAGKELAVGDKFEIIGNKHDNKELLKKIYKAK